MSINTQSDVIKGLQKGGIDTNGYNIVAIYDKGSCYAIYEIDTPDLAQRLSVFIDSVDDSTYSTLMGRFLQVQAKFIEAKGVLYKSNNINTYKQQLVNVLSNLFHNIELSIDDINSKLDEIIKDINSEHKKFVLNKIAYIMPTVLTLICSLVVFISVHEDQKMYFYYHMISLVIFGSCIGGLFSILYSQKQNDLERLSDYRLFYTIVGIERLMIAILGGIVAFCIIKSNTILPNVEAASYWDTLLILIVAGFSESLVPNLLNKISAKYEEKLK